MAWHEARNKLMKGLSETGDPALWLKDVRGQHMCPSECGGCFHRDGNVRHQTYLFQMGPDLRLLKESVNGMRSGHSD